MVRGTQLGRGASAALLLGATLGLSGCLGPTYGTGTSSGAQLVQDLDEFADLTPDSAQIAYAPRPDLVRPASVGALPPPQATRNTTNDSSWPESPEQRRARLQAAGDAASGDGDTPIRGSTLAARKEGVTDEMIAASRGSWSAEERRLYGDDSGSTVLSPTQLGSSKEEVKRRLALQNGSPKERRYLSEPPVAYRQPAASAPVGDPGEDEEVKERRVNSDGTVWDKIKGALPGS